MGLAAVSALTLVPVALVAKSGFLGRREGRRSIEPDSGPETVTDLPGGCANVGGRGCAAALLSQSFQTGRVEAAAVLRITTKVL